MLAAIMSGLHVLALGIGLGAVYARGRALRAVAGGSGSAQSVLTADNFWGAAAGVWVASGLARLFGQLDRGLDFYVYNVFFWLKMALFASVLVLEITPMVAFLRWRAALKRGQAIDTRRVPLFIKINDAETALVLVIPFVAAAMARGLWLTT